MTTQNTSFPCISVTQPIGTFYVATIPSKILIDKTIIKRRGLTEKEQENVQRRLNDDRKEEIAKYAERADSTFPTSIIVAGNSDYLHFVPETSTLILGKETIDPKVFDPLAEDENIGLVIDGQHRIEGLKLAAALHGEEILENFQMPVVFMFDMSLEDMAEVFRTINSKQRPVDPSLIIDLFGLSRKRSPRRLCHILAIGFNETEGSPLKAGLKMLGKRYKKTEFLSQGSFAKYILSLISKDPDDDEIRLEKKLSPISDPKLPLRSYFIAENEKKIADILWDYFSAVKNAFLNEWEVDPTNHLLRKTVGFSALIKIFNNLASNINFEDADYKNIFNDFFKNAKSGLGDNPFSVDKYGSSEGEAGRMAREIMEAVKAVQDKTNNH